MTSTPKPFDPTMIQRDDIDPAAELHEMAVALYLNHAVYAWDGRSNPVGWNDLSIPDQSYWRRQASCARGNCTTYLVYPALVAENDRLREMLRLALGGQSGPVAEPPSACQSAK